MRYDTMNLTLAPQLSQLIQGEVDSGRFSTPEDVIAAGVSRVLAETDLSAEELADLRLDVEVGIQQADRGEFALFTAKDIIAEGRALLAEKSQSGAG